MSLLSGSGSSNCIIPEFIVWEEGEIKGLRSAGSMVIYHCYISVIYLR